MGIWCKTDFENSDKNKKNVARARANASNTPEPLLRLKPKPESLFVKKACATTKKRLGCRYFKSLGNSFEEILD